MAHLLGNINQLRQSVLIRALKIDVVLGNQCARFAEDIVNLAVELFLIEVPYVGQRRDNPAKCVRGGYLIRNCYAHIATG